MRIAVAVVVGLALLGAGEVSRAAEAKQPRSELCLEDCNFIYDKGIAREGAKPTGRCNIDIVRCKRECPPEPVVDSNVPTVRSHEKCVDACRAVYKKCLGRAENKRNGSCAAEDMRCEKACPVPPPPVASAPPSTPAEPDKAEPGAPPPASIAPAPPPEKKPRARAARVEGAAAPAPAIATPAVAVNERPASTAPTVRSEAVTPPVTTTAAASAAARPAPPKRGFFARLGCFFRSCEPEGSTPCVDQCMKAYDECHIRESKRGGECSTRLMHCRQGCRAAAPADPAPADR